MGMSLDMLLCLTWRQNQENLNQQHGIREGFEQVREKYVHGIEKMIWSLIHL